MYRCLNLAEFLQGKGVACLFIINPDERARAILQAKAVAFVEVDFAASGSWEGGVISREGITLWWNDRLNTSLGHAERVKAEGIPLVTMDDRGEGARLVDLHFAPLALENPSALGGKAVLTGPDYLILNPEIDRFKRLRASRDRLLVTLGGSDTYGVSLRVLELLMELGVLATVHIGPAFRDEPQLRAMMAAAEGYNILKSPESLLQAFSEFDLAIAGGGITPFEANASGLPCLLISSEEHERPACRFLDAAGSSIYLGHRDELDARVLGAALEGADVPAMSRKGLDRFSTGGLEAIWSRVESLIDG